MIRTGRSPVVLASAALAAGALVFVMTAGGAPSSGRLPIAAGAAFVGTRATDVSNLGSGGWRVASSATATQTGAQISTPGFDTGSWLPVGNDDAGAPGTEVEALAQNGRCPGDTALQPVTQDTSGPDSVFFSNNIQ